MEDAVVFIYAKNHVIKVLSLEDAKEQHSDLISNEWKHTNSINACIFLTHLHNECENVFDAVKELSKHDDLPVNPLQKHRYSNGDKVRTVVGTEKGGHKRERKGIVGIIIKSSKSINENKLMYRIQFKHTEAWCYENEIELYETKKRR